MSGFTVAQNSAGDKKEEPSFYSSPAFKIAANVVLFVAGVALIQSPIMDELVPSFK